MTDKPSPEAAVSPESPERRVRELALAAAFHEHWLACNGQMDDRGHIYTAWDFGFRTCPHPDCQLVRERVALVSPHPQAEKDTMNFDREKAIKTLQMVADDMEADADAFNGKPFNGRTVAEYFGNQGAAIACAVCEGRLSCTWTDTHGVGACGTCGLPYRLYHYENDARVEKPPVVAVKKEWLPLAREYWNATRRRVFPGAFDVGVFRGRGGRTYSGATESEMEEFDLWLHEHKERWPVSEESVPVNAVDPQDGVTPHVNARP